MIRYRDIFADTDNEAAKLEQWCNNELVESNYTEIMEPPVYEKEINNTEWVPCKETSKNVFSLDNKQARYICIKIDMETDINEFYDAQVNLFYGEDNYDDEETAVNLFSSTIRYMCMIYKLNGYERIVRKNNKIMFYFGLNVMVGTKAIIQKNTSISITNYDKNVEMDMKYADVEVPDIKNAYYFGLNLRNMCVTTLVKDNMFDVDFSSGFLGSVYIGAILWCKNDFNPAILSVEISIDFENKQYTKYYNATEIKKYVSGNKTGYFVPLNNLNFKQYLHMVKNFYLVNNSTVMQNFIFLSNSNANIKVELLDATDNSNIDVEFIKYNKSIYNGDVCLQMTM